MGVTLSAILVALAGQGATAAFTSGSTTTTQITAGAASMSVTTGAAGCQPVGSDRSSSSAATDGLPTTDTLAGATTSTAAGASPGASDEEGGDEGATTFCVPTYRSGRVQEWGFRYVTGSSPSGMTGFTDTQGLSLDSVSGLHENFSATVPMIVTNEGNLPIQSLALTAANSASGTIDDAVLVSVWAGAGGDTTSGPLFSGTLAQLTAGQIVDLSGVGTLAPTESASVIVTFAYAPGPGPKQGTKSDKKDGGDDSSSSVLEPVILVTGSDG